jgi:hypothetical protein
MPRVTSLNDYPKLVENIYNHWGSMVYEYQSNLWTCYNAFHFPYYSSLVFLFLRKYFKGKNGCYFDHQVYLVGLEGVGCLRS